MEIHGNYENLVFNEISGKKILFAVVQTPF